MTWPCPSLVLGSGQAFSLCKGCRLSGERGPVCAKPRAWQARTWEKAAEPW